MIIKQLKLKSNNLTEQKHFYNGILGFEIIEENKNSIAFQIGYSSLLFVFSEIHIPYHFCFNIPSNQDIDALYWLKERLEILKNGQDEIIHFENWNADAIYFYDPENNIVEFIARKNLEYNSLERFSSNSILGISEIGISLNTIEPTAQLLYKRFGLSKHSGNVERFLAVGDEYGLFILINKNEKKYWFPSEDEALSTDFQIEFLQEGNLFHFLFENGIITSLL